MRLIDADALIEEAKELHIDDYMLVMAMVSKQPTAYDVEKVVEEINNIDLQHPCDDCPHLQECDRIQVEVPNANDLCSLVTKHYAIEAVRKGGVE